MKDLAAVTTDQSIGQLRGYIKNIALYLKKVVEHEYATKEKNAKPWKASSQPSGTFFASATQAQTVLNEVQDPADNHPDRPAP